MEKKEEECKVSCGSTTPLVQQKNTKLEVQEKDCSPQFDA